MDIDDLEDEFAEQALVEAVENQILEGHPREAGMVLTGLLEKGVGRTESLALMAEVLARHIDTMFHSEGKGFDINAYARDLLRLTEE